jgi:hypothetical protein
MSCSRRLILSTAPALLLVRNANAQGDRADDQLSTFQLMNGWVLSVTPDGRVVRRGDVAEDLSGEIMKAARPMALGSVMIMHQNRLYVSPDRAIRGGTMLCDAIAR